MSPMMFGFSQQRKQILNGENGNLDVLKRLQKIRLELLRMKEEL